MPNIPNSGPIKRYKIVNINISTGNCTTTSASENLVDLPIFEIRLLVNPNLVFDDILELRISATGILLKLSKNLKKRYTTAIII